MCQNPVSIDVKSVSLHGVRFAHVPCGKCPECRQQYKSEWAFRLSVELESLKRQGWLIGFGTLTYNNHHLPFIPKEAFEIDAKFRKIQCFRRSDARTFVDSLRKELHSHYHLKGLRYFVASEFGEHTKRSHIHFLLCWQPLEKVDSHALSDTLDAPTMHRYICRLWRKGFVFPWSAFGGEDKHGYYHKPFEVSASAFDAAHYASKYACKDLAYKVDLSGVAKKSVAYKDCKQYHIQSRSLGASLLLDKNSEELQQLYNNGYEFVSNSSRFSLPRYLKNKILFKPRYYFCSAVDGHEFKRVKKDKMEKRFDYIDTLTGEVFSKMPSYCKRLVRRKPTTFFIENKKNIYAQKVVLLQERLTQFFYDKNFQASLELPESILSEIEPLRKSFISYDEKYGKKDKNIADDITLYYGMPYRSCFAPRRTRLKSVLWFNRFRENPSFILNNLITKEQYFEIHSLYNRYSRIMSFRHDYIEQIENERYINKVNNFIRG